MKKILLLIAILSMHVASYAQTRVVTREISNVQLTKAVSATKQKVYQIDASAFLRAPKSVENSSINVRLPLDNKEYDLVLAENTMLQNAPAYYTDENGVLHEAEMNVKLYAGYLKDDSTKYVRLSVIDNQYIDGYINLGDDFLYLSSPKENQGRTSLYYGRDIIIPDSCEAVCGTPDLEILENEELSTLVATSSYDFENNIRIMKIAADADVEFYNANSDPNNPGSTNERMVSLLNQVEGLYANTFNIAFQIVYTHYYQSASTGYPYTPSIISDGGVNLLNSVMNYWNTNFVSIDRNATILFTGKYNKIGVDELYGMARVGGMTNKSTSYMWVVERGNNTFLTLAHELGHLCGGDHSDCQNNGSSAASIMCQGQKQNPPYFSSASITRIGNHIGSNDYLQKISITSGPSVMARNATVTYTTSATVPSVLNWAYPSMDLLSTSGTSTTFKALRDGSSYVRLYKIGGAKIEKEIHIGTPVPEITGEHRVPNGQYATFRASCSPLANASNWHWILNPVNGNTVYGANSQVLDVAFYNTGSYQVLARASNSYGTGEYTSFGLNVINSSSYSSIAYPNPASQTLYVDFTSIGEQPAQTFSSTAGQQKHYDVRLFNLQGSLVRTARSAGEQISLDVSGLPGGNYFLHIYDGKGEKPVVQQVIVSH